MTWRDGVVAAIVVAGAVILRWHRSRYRKWSVHVSIDSERRKDDGPTPER